MSRFWIWFWIWWTGFFTLWGAVWFVVAVLNGHVGSAIFQACCAVFQIYWFGRWRWRLRLQREQEDLELWEDDLP